MIGLIAVCKAADFEDDGESEVEGVEGGSGMTVVHGIKISSVSSKQSAVTVVIG